MKTATAMPSTAGHGHPRQAVLYVTTGRASRQAVFERLAQLGVPASSAADPNQALRMLAAQPAALALVDLADDRAALAGIRAIAVRCPGVAVAAVVDAARPDVSAEAIQAGAFDLLPWPFQERDVLTVLANARDRAVAEPDGKAASGGAPVALIAHSDAMRTLTDRLDGAIRARGVLITGEPGSGRSHLARVLHARRAGTHGDGRPFIVEDCSVGGPAALERRLFGVQSSNGYDARNGRAAFERVARDGTIHRARGGTLSLVNLPDAPARLQARLARLLRDREAELADQPGTLVDLDQHVIVCADPGVDEAIADGRVRPELYDRVAQARIDVPPLRRRREDIPALAVSLIREACSARGVPAKGITRSALKVLAALPWRGNVAELKTLGDLLVRTSSRAVIDLDDVLEHASFEDAVVRVDLGMSLREAKARFERECIAATLARHQGRVSEAARALGIQRTNLYRKVRELQVVRPRPSARHNG